MNETFDLTSQDSIEDPGPLVSNFYLVQELQNAILAAPRDIDRLRGALREVLTRQPPAFADRIDPNTGKRFRRGADEFAEFLHDQFPDGCQSDPATMRRLLKDSEELILFNKALDYGKGGNNNPFGCRGKPDIGLDEESSAADVINVLIKNIDSPSSPKKPRGGKDDVPYAHRRLARERPDLLEQVKTGELSAHGAMIQAGFRKVPTPLEILRKAWSKATPAERQTFLDELKHDGWLPS